MGVRTVSQSHCLVLGAVQAWSGPMPRHVGARVFATSSGATVLFEADRVPAFSDGPGRLRLVLELPREVSKAVARRPVRFLSLGRAEPEQWSARTPFSTSTLRLEALWEGVDHRLRGLEMAWTQSGIGEVLQALRSVIDDHEHRLGSVESHATVHALAERLLELEQRTSRIDGAGGALVHLQDELEDLVGTDGDILDLHTRLSRLEAQLWGVGRSPRRVEE